MDILMKFLESSIYDWLFTIIANKTLLNFVNHVLCYAETIVTILLLLKIKTILSKYP